ASSYSERNIVVHVAVAGAGRHRTARRGAGRTAGPEIAAGIIGPDIAATAAAAAIEHGQRRIEPLQHHFSRVFFDAGLVGPFARLQLAFDVNLGALLQILLGDLAEPFVEDDDPMPLGLFLALAGRLVAPAIGGRHAQIGNRPPILGPPNFRILAEISDQNHLVYASRHHHSPSSKITGKITALAGRSAVGLSSGVAVGSLRVSLDRPYTLPSRARSRSPGYPHIASLRPMFQFCSIQ